MLSVSGVRGIVGESMTPSVAVDFAAAFGTCVKRGTGSAHPVLCLGRDTRPSSEMLAAGAAAGLAAVGAQVVDLGVVATPTAAVMVIERQAAGGLVVTASHNPAEWNGLKCIAAGGIAPGPDAAAQIARRFERRDLDLAAPDAFAPRSHDASGNGTHVTRVLAQVDREAIRSARPRVVLDSNNGAGGAAGRTLLDELGCETIHLNPEPSGRFAHGPEPVEENLQQLARAVVAEGADIGFAQDPDADRLAIVDETGRCLGEERTLVLAARHWLDRHGTAPIVVNLSTSRMIDDLTARYPGAAVHRTPVGEANVAERMQRIGAPIGGEGNGGVILGSVSWTRDSLSAMALVLGLLAEARRPLSVVAADLPSYVMIKDRLQLDPDRVDDLMRAAARRAARRFDRVNTDDGVRVDAGDGWVHLRPSNTEPIVRLIAEAPTRQRARALIDEVVGEIKPG